MRGTTGRSLAGVYQRAARPARTVYINRWTKGGRRPGQWRSGRASDFRPRGHWFDPRSGRCCVTTRGKLFTPTCLHADSLRYYMESLNWVTLSFGQWRTRWVAHPATRHISESIRTSEPPMYVTLSPPDHPPRDRATDATSNNTAGEPTPTHAEERGTGV